MFQHPRKGGRGGELLPGVGCCHGVPSGDSIGARQAHQSLNASGRACSLRRNPKVAPRRRPRRLQERIDSDLLRRRVIGRHA